MFGFSFFQIPITFVRPAASPPPVHQENTSSSPDCADELFPL
jgi:hypothetical protein